MEAIFAPSATEQSSSPFKQMRNHPPKRNTRDFAKLRTTENSAPSNYIIHGGNCGNGGLFFNPPPSAYYSYPPPSPVMYPPPQIQKPPSQQPPLLPLPVSKPRHNSLPSRFGRELLSSPPIAKTSTQPRDQNRTLKKPRNPIDKRGEIKRTQSLITPSTVPLVPDPKNPPKNAPKVSSPLPPSSFSSMAGIITDLEKISGPHPSSLPMPKFVKPKLSCKTEAAAVVGGDAGAADNLRRLLRLR